MAEPVYLTGALTKASLAAMPPPFPDPAQPEQPPFEVIPVAAHLSTEVWQTSFYDATSPAPMGAFTQRPSGPCDLVTGRLKGQEWHTSGTWKQV
jgi:hypothetical protein